MTKLLAFLLAACGYGALAASPSTAPNVILILADDLGIGNLSCYGADNFKTPRLDGLASTGMRFQNCFATPLCGPSRALLLTGRYGFRTGMTGNGSGKNLESATEVMIPRVLKPAGYISGCFGKWGQLPLQPSDFGFDEYMRFHNSGVYWKGPKNSSYVVNGKNRDLPEGKYMPDLVHENVLDFISRHRNQPFFAYYSLSHIHGDIVRTPDSAPNSDLYADNIAYMDKLVGNLVDELEKLKLREKTLILFLGDNGTGQRHAPRSTIRGKPLSGHKSEMLEGGALVPMIANWPGKVPSGRISKDLVDFSDFLPTLADLAASRMPPGLVVDGQSFANLLRGKQEKTRDWIFVQLGVHWYVRDAGWKLNETGELFDMTEAPFKETMVPTGNEPAQAKAERKKLGAILDRLDPASGKQHQGNPSGKHDRKMTEES